MTLTEREDLTITIFVRLWSATRLDDYKPHTYSMWAMADDLAESLVKQREFKRAQEAPYDPADFIGPPANALP